MPSTRTVCAVDEFGSGRCSWVLNNFVPLVLLFLVFSHYPNFLNSQRGYRTPEQRSLQLSLRSNNLLFYKAYK